jgi:Na+-transporting methylmalonyl-CoA/oxaloacetate decarboxylase gamma subunit
MVSLISALCRDAIMISFKSVGIGVVGTLIFLVAVVNLLGENKEQQRAAAMPAPAPVQQAARPVNDGCDLAGAIPDCKAVMAKLAAEHPAPTQAPAPARSQAPRDDWAAQIVAIKRSCGIVNGKWPEGDAEWHAAERCMKRNTHWNPLWLPGDG